MNYNIYILVVSTPHSSRAPNRFLKRSAYNQVITIKKRLNVARLVLVTKNYFELFLILLWLPLPNPPQRQSFLSDWFTSFCIKLQYHTFLADLQYV